jgi:hypothetical protein
MSEGLDMQTGPAGARGAWYRQSILWLGASIFAASLAGCIVMIVLGARHPDEAVAVEGPTVLKMPLEHPAEERRDGTP